MNTKFETGNNNYLVENNHPYAYFLDHVCGNFYEISGLSYIRTAFNKRRMKYIDFRQNLLWQHMIRA